MAVQPQAQPQEIVINDFSAGIFTHREFASAQSAQDGAGAEFINATDQPVPLTDYSPQPFTFPPTPVDLSARLYAYGCSGSISGLQPLPRLVASFIDQAEQIAADVDNWGPVPRQVAVSTALVSPLGLSYTSDSSADVSTPAIHPDQLHVLYAYYYDNNGTGDKNLHYLWRSYTSLAPNTPSYAARTHVQSFPSNTSPANTQFHFASGGLTVVRISKDLQYIGQYVSPKVVGVFGQENSNITIDGFQSGAAAIDSFQEQIVNTVVGTWMFPSSSFQWTVSNIDPHSGTFRARYPAGCLAHQNRLITLASGDVYITTSEYLSSSASSPLPDSIKFSSTNETLFYNNPYVSKYAVQDDTEAFTTIPDAVGGFGSWVSMNANELFLVKNRGGATVVRGDVAVPQLVSLPGVESAYGMGVLGTVTPLGYVYGTRDGVFAWNGGDLSNPLSAQLGRNAFWDSHTTTNAYKSPTLPKGKMAYRFPYVYCPGNWMLDVRTKSWCRLAPPSDDTDYFSYDISANGSIYATNLNLSPSVDTPVFAVYDPNVSQSSYRWISQPLIRTQSSESSFREVSITATGKSNITVTLIGIDGVREVIDFPAHKFSNTRPSTVKGAAKLLAEDVTVVVEVEADTPDSPAATVHRISLVYLPGHSVVRV